MWGGTTQFDFQENTGGMGGAAPKEFSFVGQDGGAAAEEAAYVQAEADSQYPLVPMMQPPHLYAPDPMVAGLGMNPYAYGPPYGPAYGPGGYGGMGAVPAQAPTFLGNLIKGALIGGVVVGTLTYFLKRRKRR